jgi:hypothetical protein
MSNGDSAKAKDAFLQQGGSLPFWQKVEDLHNEAVTKEQDRQIKLTVEQRAADTAKQQKIGSALFAISSLPDPEQQRQQFDQTAQQLIGDKTIKPEEFKTAFPNGYPGPVMLRMAALKSMEISKQVEATKPSYVQLGTIPVSPAGVAGEPIGKKEPTSDVSQYIDNWMKERNLPNTPANWARAHFAYTKETKVEPGMIRAEAFAETRGMPVTDTKTGVTAPMSWADYNKLSKGEPGRWTSPQYDAQTQSGVLAWRDLGKGKTRDQLTSYDAFLQHTGQLSDAIGELKNTNFPFLNKSINWLRSNSGDPRVKTFLAKLDPVQKEFESFLLNNRALYEEDRKAAENIIDVNASPAQMLAVLPSLAHTGTARLQALNSSFKRATGEDIPNLISPQSQQVLNKLRVAGPEIGEQQAGTVQRGTAAGAGATGTVQVRDPRGVVHTFPNQQSADAFKKRVRIP